MENKIRYIVGRVADGDLKLSKDSSISRTHAYLYPADDHIQIVDNKSTYGTYFVDENGSETKIDNPLELKDGQKIHFGKLDNIWVISKVEFKTTTSTISESVKRKLLKNLNVIGGSILPQWTDECTHVTMPALSVTLKVLQALVSFCPIVSPDYWDVLIQCIKNNEPIPDCENFVPNIIEQNLSKDVELYKKNPIRSKLFAGKKIIFLLTKDLNNYKNIIKAAGGTADTVQNLKTSTTTFSQKNVIVIRPSNNCPPTESQCFQKIDKVEQILKSKNLRCIPEIELGLAIMHCSLEKYCNPESSFEIYFNSIKYSEKEILAKNTVTSQNKQENTIDLPETDNLNKSLEIVSDVVLIDSEMMEVASSSTSHKRKNSSELGNASKKPSFDTSDEIVVEPNSVDYGENSEIPEISNSNKIVVEPNSVDYEEASEIPEVSRIIEIDNDETPTVSLNSFINTSQIVHEDFPELPLPGTSQEIMPPPRSSFIRKSSKRMGRISDDEDDLFNFEDSGPKKRKRVEEPIAKDLFAFEKGKSSKKSPAKKSKPASRPVAKNTVEMLPKTFSFCFEVKESSAWLSTTMIDQLKIDDIKVKDEVDGSEDTKSELMTSFNPFKVKVMNVSFRRLETSVVSNESANNSGKKNFKGFVKKRNYKPQTQVISTEPYCV